ncbi:MAG: ABC transporter ATP-binding protein [Phycisphaerae bacterium]
MSENGTLLRLSDLRTVFRTEDGEVRAVDGVSFRLRRGETFALVGESGCGKSVTALSILRLIRPPGRSTAARMELEGRDLLRLNERSMRNIRGGEISMIFQEPMSSLNPVFTCGNQIVEAIRLHRGLSRGEARKAAIELLELVGIPEPAQRVDEYPHQLSGGMRQRVMVAMALSCNPKLLIADEPTTALDVTIQAQILDLLNELQRDSRLSILLITHDLAVVSETARTVAVMYASGIVELTDADRLFAQPLHPYTEGLFRSLPRLGRKKERLDTIPGSVPNPLEFPTGCKFHPRCGRTRRLAAEAEESETVAISDGDRVLKRCAERQPPLREPRQGHWCACWEAPDSEKAPETDPSEPPHESGDNA